MTVIWWLLTLLTLIRNEFANQTNPLMAIQPSPASEVSLMRVDLINKREDIAVNRHPASVVPSQRIEHDVVIDSQLLFGKVGLMKGKIGEEGEAVFVELEVV